MKRACVAFALVSMGLSAFTACGGDDDTVPAATDAGSDTGADAGRDTGADTGVDSGVDSGGTITDAGTDADSGFDACAPIVITKVDPQFAFKGGPTAISITGSGFVATPKVYLEGAPALVDAGVTDAGDGGDGGASGRTQITHAAFISSTSMTAIIPADTFASGTYALRVVNPNGCAGTIANAVKVVDQAPPTVISVEPAAGTTQADTKVTITGCHFDVNATVSVVSSTGAVTAQPAPSAPVAGGNDPRCGGAPLYTMTGTISSTLATGAYLVRVTNTTPGTFGDYASFVITNPSANPGNPEASSPLSGGRRSLALVSGRVDDANRFLYVIGGEGANGAPLDTVEVAPVDKFGQLGTWAVQKNKLPAAISGAAAARWGNWIYVIGGTSSTDGTGGLTPTGSPTTKIYRAPILAPSGAPKLKDPPVAPLTTGNLAQGTWYYKVAALTAGGEESLASDEVVVNLDAKGSATIDWTAPAGPAPTGYKIYRSPAADGVSQTEVLLDTVGAVTTYTDDGSKTAGTETYLSVGATGKWITDSKQLLGARLDASAVAVKSTGGNTYLYVTGGWGVCSGAGSSQILSCVSHAQIQDDGSLSDFTDLNGLVHARMRHGIDRFDKSNGATAFGDGGAPLTSSFVVVGGGRGTTSLGSGASVEYAAVQADGSLGSWVATSSAFSEREALGFGLANGRGYAFVGGAVNGNKINYTQTGDSAQAINVTATGFDFGSWNSVGSFLSGSPNGKRGRVGLTAESAYFYLVGGTTDDKDALTDVYRVLH